jgi:transketolase
VQIDGEISEINGLEPLDAKWRSFGWNVISVDGHDVNEINSAIEEAKKSEDKPTMILLNTLKGKGVSFLEKIWKNNHNVTLSPEQRKQALEELKEV